MKLSKEARAHWTKEQRRYYKHHGVPMPEQCSEIIPALPISQKVEKVTVLCVKFGTRYGREYVERLRNMVSKHLTVPYEFVCLTDDQHPISGVRSIIQKPAGYSKLWWHKVHMFDPSLPISGKILYFDLDIVIHQNIDKLLISNSNQFLGIRDFNRKFYASWQYLNSSAMSWYAGHHSYIYENFKKDPASAMKLQGDQDWIWKTGKNKISFWPDEWIQSYKWEIRSRDELKVRTGIHGFKTLSNVEPSPGCCVAVFHGDPKPQDVQDKFVVDNWC
jgi:hypothetical protein